jgi:hypothetical protein
MARARRVLLWVAGSVVGLGALLLLAGGWWVSTLHETEQADAARAGAAFGEIRARFSGVQPVFEIRDDRLAVVRESATPASAAATSAHMLIWEPDERTLSRLRLPLVMSMVATEPIPLDALAGVGHDGIAGIMEAQRRGHELNIRLSDLERYGQTLLLDDVTADGRHIVMWND